MTNFNFRSDKNKIITRMYILVLSFIIFISAVAVIFVHNVLNIESKTAESFLMQSVMQTASNIRSRINNDINDLEMLASELVLNYPSLKNKEILNFLNKNIPNPRYYRLGFSHNDGSAIRVQSNNSEISHIDWNSESCFNVALSGQPCFAKTLENKQSHTGYTNRYFVPVYDKSKNIIGVLGSYNDSDVFRRILSYNTFDNNGYSRVISNDGSYIIKSRKDKDTYGNFFDLNLKLLDTTKEQLLDDFKNKEQGIFHFKYFDDGKVYVSAFVNLRVNDSVVLTDVPENILMHNVHTLLSVISLIVILMTISFLVLLVYTKRLYTKNEVAINKVAFTDEVTQSINKTKFLLDAREFINSNSDTNYTMLSMDITKFKVINELYGYNRSNKILKDVFDIIKQNLPKKSLCARDFAATYVILLKYDDKNSIINFMDNIFKEIDKYNQTVMQNLTSENDTRLVSKLAVIFGIFLIEDKKMFIAQMCDRASIAKRNIKNFTSEKYYFYDDSIRAQVLQDKAIEDEMFSALENNQFKMFLQPKFDIGTLTLSGAEALVRWFHPVRGMVPPIEFIPLFEKNGFIIELDKYIWSSACEFLSNRKKAGEPLFPISVNVSRLHLNNDAFIDELLKLLAKHDIDPKYLELEVTESACLNNEKRFIEIVNKLKSKGFSIAMDDFGTGYSSLSILRLLPVDILKLDRGFITESYQEEKGQIVIKSIIDMADKLKILTVAEGIETPDQVDFLKNAGCKIVQGFLYGRPMDVEKFTQSFLSNENSIS